jgi:hypothetical protein
MANNDVWLTLCEWGTFLATLSFKEIGDGLGGESNPVESEIARYETSPAGGAKLDGAQGIAHRGLTFPVEGVFLKGIYVADQKNTKEGDHGAEYEVGIYCRKHILVDDGPREQKDHLNVEEDEQHRHKVKFHGHAAGPLPFSGHAAFVRAVLGGVAFGAFAYKLGNDEVAGSESNGYAQ